MQWGDILSNLFDKLDKLKRISKRLEIMITDARDDPFNLIKVKSEIDEILWTMELDIRAFNSYIDRAGEHEQRNI